MRLIKIFLLIIYGSIPLITQASYCWMQRSNVGTTNRYAAMGFSIGTKGYVACGYSGGGKNDLWEYDAITNTWTQKANYPGGNIWAGAGFAVGNKGYISIGTGGSNYPTDTYEYNPANNTWTSKAPFPSSGRQDCWAFGIGNYGYIVGGWKPGYYNETWRFDPALNAWTQMAAFGGGVISGMRGFVIGNIAYSVGGLNSVTIGSNQIWAYDPAANSWTSKASLPGTGRHSATCFEMNGKGIAGGGFNGSTGFIDFYEYTPSTNSWTTITPYSSTRPLGYPVCFTIGSEGYIATGKTGTSSNSNQTWMLTTGISASINFTTNVCGDQYNFTSNAPGATSYSWDFGDGTNSTSSNPTHQYATPGPYVVTLSVSNGSCTGSTTQNIVVNAAPAAIFSVSIDTCTQTISIQNNSINAGSYNWNFGDGQSSTNINPTHTYTNTGPYTITLIAYSSSQPGCNDTTSANINITNPALQASATVQADCNNGVNITNFSSTVSNYTWIWGDGTQTTGSSNYHQYTLPGSYIIQLALANSLCLDTIDFPVNISSGPTASFTATSNCDLSININNTTLNGTTYSWNWGNNQNSSGNVANYQYTQPGPYLITLIANNGVCTDTTSQTITVFQPVNSSFTASTDCGNAVNITNNSQGATLLNWDLGNGSTSSGILPSYTYQQSGNYTITLIASNNQCSDTSSINIIAQTSPNANINSFFNTCRDSIRLWSGSLASSYTWFINNVYQSNDSSFYYNQLTPSTQTIKLIAANGQCKDTDIVSIDMPGAANASFNTFVSCDGSVQSTPSTSGLFQYIWDNGLGNTTNLENFSYNYTGPGNYSITLIVSNGYCSDTSSYSFDIGNSISYSLNLTTDSCNRRIIAEISPDTNVQIIWNLGDGSVLYGNPITHEFNNSQLFNNIVYIDSTSNCGDTIQFTIDYSLVNSGENTFIPNSFTPNNDEKNDFFSIANEICNFKKIIIYNRWGQIVFESEDQHFKWDGQLKNTALPEGVYLYLIQTKNDRYSGTVSIFR